MFFGVTFTFWPIPGTDMDSHVNCSKINGLEQIYRLVVLLSTASSWSPDHP